MILIAVILALTDPATSPQLDIPAAFDAAYDRCVANPNANFMATLKAAFLARP
ncbi:MAG: hypothetical protein ACHP7N_09355 [Caulobacterales bacterium]